MPYNSPMTTIPTDLPPAAVEAAYARLRDVVRRTPVLAWGSGGAGLPGQGG